jgi:opacity protein-like surface antigen
MARPLNRALRWLGTVTALACAGAACAADWELDLDGRLVSVNGPPPLIDGGLGSVRFGGDQSGVRLGRARFAVAETFGEIWSLHLDASSWGDHDRIPAGLTEGYLQMRPYPWAGWRLRVKAGAFYAPISLENRSSGWESPYTLSYSAIDSWLAQEVRTIGSEAQLDWLGTRTGHDFDLGLTAGVFGWDDKAGAALTDRQTVLGGRVGKPGVPPVNAAEPFREMDGRAGVYAGLEARYLDRIVVRFLRYDNQANPTAFDTVSHTVAWNTTFNSAGARIDGARGWTAIFQWLDGQTHISPNGFYAQWPFRARYLLLSKRFGDRHTLSARYDQFEVEGYGEDDEGWQKGHAITLAYVFRPGARWRFTLEWLHVVSTSYNREEFEDVPTASQTQVQLAIRYALGPLAR